MNELNATPFGLTRKPYEQYKDKILCIHQIQPIQVFNSIKKKEQKGKLRGKRRERRHEHNCLKHVENQITNSQEFAV